MRALHTVPFDNLLTTCFFVRSSESEIKAEFAISMNVIRSDIYGPVAMHAGFVRFVCLIFVLSLISAILFGQWKWPPSIIKVNKNQTKILPASACNGHGNGQADTGHFVMRK